MSSIDRWNYDNQSSDVEEGEIIEDNNNDLTYQFCVPSDDTIVTTNSINNKRCFNEIDSNTSNNEFYEPLPKRQKVSSQITSLYLNQSLNDSLYSDYHKQFSLQSVNINID